MSNQNEFFRRVLYNDGRVEVTVQCLRPGQEIAWEKHTQSQLFLVTNGTLQVQTRAGSKLLQRGDLFIVPPGTEHQVQNNSYVDVHFTTFYFPPDHPMGLIEQ